MESHVHQFYALRVNCFVVKYNGGGFISLFGRGWLRPSHLDECLEQRNHLFSCNKKRAKLRFSCRGHDEFDDCGNGENCSIKYRRGVIFWEKNMRAWVALLRAFVDVWGTIVSGQNHITCPIGDSVVWVYFDVINELLNSRSCVHCSRCFMRTNGAKGNH